MQINNLSSLAEAFQIFSAYGVGYTQVTAHNGNLAVALDANRMSLSDINRLRSLGWHYSTMTGFYLSV